MRAFVGAIILSLGSVTLAKGDVAFSDLVGRWTGSGEIAASPQSAPEPARCRVEVEQDASLRSLGMTGRCAISVGAASLSLRLIELGDGRLGAGVGSSAFEGTIQMEGQNSDNSIVLTSRTPIMHDGTVYSSRVEIRTDDGMEFTLREWIALEGEDVWTLTKFIQFVR